MFHNPLVESRTPTRVHVNGQPQHQMAEGLGFNWYSGFEPAVYPAATDEGRWERIFGHAEFLNIRFLRFGQVAQQISNQAGQFQPGHASFDQLRRVDAWAQGRGVSLFLDPFAIPSAWRFPPIARQPGHWGLWMAARDIDGYVSQFIVPYVRHVVQELGCRSVCWFNHVNEPFGPGGAYSTPPGVDQHRQYHDTVKAIRQGLDEAGLGQIGQLGPDCHDTRVWPVPEMIARGVDPDPYLAGYDLHSYHSRFDWAGDTDNLRGGTATISELLQHNLGPAIDHAQQRGKPFFLGEVGNFYYGWKWGDPAGIARHDNVLGELEFILRAVNRGCDGALRWAWLNPGTVDGWWQLLQTTDGSDQPLRDPYYGYATLYRHVGHQATVLHSQVQHGPEQDRTVHALAVKNQDGSQALCLINDSYANPVTIEVELENGVSGALQKFATDHVRKYQPCDDFRAEAVNGSAQWRDVLSPMSLTVYTTQSQGS